MSSVAVDPDISLRDVIELASSNRWSLSYSPMMNAPTGTGATILRSASPLKGESINEDETVEQFAERMEEKHSLDSPNGGYSQGLTKAVSFARNNLDDVEGLAVGRVDGTPRILPNAGFKAIEEAPENPREVTDKTVVDSMIEAQRALDQMGGRNAKPQVF